MPGYGIPCPQPDMGAVGAMVQENAGDLYQIILALAQPLNCCLMDCENQLSQCQRKLHAAVKAGAKRARTATEAITDTINLILGVSVTEADQTIQNIPPAVQSTGTFPTGTAGAGFGGESPVSAARDVPSTSPEAPVVPPPTSPEPIPIEPPVAPGTQLPPIIFPDGTQLTVVINLDNTIVLQLPAAIAMPPSEAPAPLDSGASVEGSLVGAQTDMPQPAESFGMNEFGD